MYYMCNIPLYNISVCAIDLCQVKGLSRVQMCVCGPICTKSTYMDGESACLQILCSDTRNNAMQLMENIPGKLLLYTKLA